MSCLTLSIDFNASRAKKIHLFGSTFVNLTDSHAKSALEVGNSADSGSHSYIRPGSGLNPVGGLAVSLVWGTERKAWKVHGSPAAYRVDPKRKTYTRFPRSQLTDVDVGLRSDSELAKKC